MGAARHAPEISNGMFFYGDKATVFVTDDHWTVIPRAKGEERKTFPVTGDTGLKHVQNWLEAIRTRKQPMCLP